MRLTPDRAKRGILHPERHAREAAVNYFAGSYNQDAEIIPLAIRAIEQYGAAAFETNVFFGTLIHSDATLRWMIDRRASLPVAPEDPSSLWSGLTAALCHVDPALMKSHEAQILALQPLDADTRLAIRERFRLHAEAPDALWADLDDFCQRHQHHQTAPEPDLKHAGRLAEALSRHPQFAKPRVLELLAQPIKYVKGNSLAWMEPFAVRMAGRMRLEEAIPAIVGRLSDGSEWISDECLSALTQIGTDAVGRAVARAYPQGSDDFRFHAAGLLEGIHSDDSVATCWKLLEHEQSDQIRQQLFKALLIHGDPAVFEPVRTWLLSHPRDPDWLDLRADLISAATLMETEFPELAAWKEDLLHDVAFRRQWYADFFGRPLSENIT